MSSKEEIHYVDDLMVVKPKPEDYQEVMNIEKHMLLGLDHMYSKYFDYIKDPKRDCMIAIKNGKIIYFGLLFFTDGGRFF